MLTISEYVEKQIPILLIGSNDLNAEYYQQLASLVRTLGLKLSVIGKTTIYDKKDYLILNNQIPLPKKYQFKRNLYGHQIHISSSGITNPYPAIHIWQSQNDYPDIQIEMRRKLLLIENTIIAVLESASCELQYLPGDVSQITEIERQAITWIAETLQYQAGWMIEYFIDTRNEIHITCIDPGYDLNVFISTGSQLELSHILSKLLEQYFSNKLRTPLLSHIDILNNGHQRFNLIAAYHLNIDIKPVKGSLDTAKLTYLNRNDLVSRCAMGRGALTLTFANRYTSKKKFQQRLLKKYPDMVIPTIYLSNKVNYTVEKIEQLISNWSFPLILKPDNGISCDNLFIDLRSAQDILDAHQKILSHQYEKSLLQPRLSGKEYRILLVDQSVVAIARKIPALLVGDGKSTIKELILKYNNHYKYYINEVCNNVANNFYIKLHPDKTEFRTIPAIQMNEELNAFLAQKALTIDSVLLVNDTLEFLYVNINGAIWENAWGTIDESILEKIRQVHIDMGLKINGADVLITDENELKIFEFNCYPAIMFHHFILHGKPEPAIQAVYKYLFKMQ